MDSTNKDNKPTEECRSTMRAFAKRLQEQLFPRVEYRVHRPGNTHKLGSPENPICGGTIIPSLCDIVLQARASITGASDPWPDDCLKEVAEMLRVRVQTWDVGGSLQVESHIIDNAVNVMCRACIDMIELELKSRRERGSEYPRTPGNGSYPGIQRDEANASKAEHKADNGHYPA